MKNTERPEFCKECVRADVCPLLEGINKLRRRTEKVEVVVLCSARIPWSAVR
jgi:hypothetical protein